MTTELKEQISQIVSQFALLTAACEGNMYHDKTIINEAIYLKCLEIQDILVNISI